MILNRQRTVRIARPALESFLRRIRRHLRLGKAEVTICFVTDAEIARMNKAFRRKNGPTDVLSFPVAQTFLPVRTSIPSSRNLRSTTASIRTGYPDRGDPAFSSARFVRAGSSTARTQANPRRAQAAVRAASPTSRHFSLPTRDSFLGDIAISPATARRNAQSAGRPLTTELRILMLHGILHLLGYDHETDTGQMARLEQNLRRQLGLA
jgi:rRNA maturation RNase YbeY